MAAFWGWDHFADQSSLFRTRDALTQKTIESLRASIRGINQKNGAGSRSRLAQILVAGLRFVWFTLWSNRPGELERLICG